MVYFRNKKTDNENILDKYGITILHFFYLFLQQILILAQEVMNVT